MGFYRYNRYNIEYQFWLNPLLPKAVARICSYAGCSLLSCIMYTPDTNPSLCELRQEAPNWWDLGCNHLICPPPQKKACVNSKQYMLEGVRIKWHVYLRFQFLHLIVMQNTFAPPVFSSLLLFSSPSTHPGCHQHELPSACQTPGISRTSDGESGDAKWIHADIYIYINTYIHIYIYPLQTWLDGHTFLTLPYLHQRFTRNQLSFRPMAAYISH